MKRFFIKNNKIKIYSLLNKDLSKEMIFYSFFESKFGNLAIASTIKGICYIGFYDNENEVIKSMESRFYGAKFSFEKNHWIEKAEKAIIENKIEDLEINLNLLGTEFQLKVWGKLLEIPQSMKVTYADVAREIGSPKASRVVGTAIGKNPIALLIPCHRVVLSSGSMGNYFWGEDKKRQILEYEGLV